MKRFTKFMVMAAIAAIPFAFTSCDDDDDWYYDDGPWWYGYNDGGYRWNDNYYNHGGGNDDDDNRLIVEAQTLAGEWDGQMAYTNGADNNTTSNFYANMTFSQNNTTATKGTGTEIDYLLDGSGNVSDSQTLKFDWYIADNGDIYVRYASGSTFVLDINADQHGFSLNDTAFKGYMIGSNNNDLIYFDFTRQTSEAKAAFGTSVTSKASQIFGSSAITPMTGKTWALPRR